MSWFRRHGFKGQTFDRFQGGFPELDRFLEGSVNGKLASFWERFAQLLEGDLPGFLVRLVFRGIRPERELYEGI